MSVSADVLSTHIDYTAWAHILAMSTTWHAPAQQALDNRKPLLSR
jgi:hypothetical protein